MKQPAEENIEPNLSIITLSAGNASNKALTRECMITHDNKPSVCHFAQTLSLERQTLANQLQSLASFGKVRTRLAISASTVNNALMFFAAFLALVVVLGLGLLWVLSESRGRSKTGNREGAAATTEPRASVGQVPEPMALWGGHHFFSGWGQVWMNGEDDTFLTSIFTLFFYFYILKKKNKTTPDKQ